jgi:hypothetical protein
MLQVIREVPGEPAVGADNIVGRGRDNQADHGWPVVADMVGAAGDREVLRPK